MMDNGHSKGRKSVHASNPMAYKAKAMTQCKDPTRMMRKERYDENSLININGISSIAPELRLLRLTSTESEKERKLILHFDVRNTILVADSVWSVNVEQALNSFLSGVTWGQETENGEWEWLCDEPTLTPPVQNATTYYRHVEKKTVHTPNDRAALRQLTGNFTQEVVGQRFIPHFRRLLRLLEWPHKVRDELLTMNGKDKTLYHYLVPAFLRLIQILVQKRRRFSIVIRTFGMDAPQVLEAVEKTTQGKHPSFPCVMPVKINRKPGRITREDEGKMQFETINENGISKCGTFGTEKAIYEMLNITEGISGFVDHFEYWAKNFFHHSAAKPFWVDTIDPDPDVHHIFFDDNIRTTDEDSIVHARTFNDVSKTTTRAMSQEEIAVYENACLVQANLLESVENDNYFLEKIDECEHRFEAILQERRLTTDQNLGDG